MKILVLGAAGAMARVIVRDLLDSEGVDRIGLADLNFDRVKAEATRLADDRLEPLKADAKDAVGLIGLMSGWDVVINSTWYELNLAVMGSAINVGIHYLDLGGLYHMTLKQLALDSKAKDADVTCVLGMGSSPGVTNLMAAYGARRLSTIDEVKIRVGGTTIRPSSGVFTPPYSFRTILDEACMPAVILRAGKIMEVPGLSVKEEFALPEPFGKAEGYYTLHSELATLPENIGRGVREMNFIVAFSPEFSRSLVLLVKLGFASKEELSVRGSKVVPYDLLTSLVDALPRTGEEAVDFGVRRVEFFGEDKGRKAHLVYDCVSGPHERWKIGGRPLGTGVPASLGAQWLARGSIKERGVLPPELCIEPQPFFHELSERGRGIMTYEDDGTNRRLV